MKTTIEQLKALLPCEKFVITGSFALSLMGLYDPKKVGDIDIIIVNPTDESLTICDRLQELNPANTKGYSKDMFIFKHNTHVVNIFVSKKEETELEYNGTAISKVSGIVSAKKGYGRMKDWLQLRKLSKIFFIQSEFEKFLDSKV